MTYLENSLPVYNKKYAKKRSTYERFFMLLFTVLVLYIYLNLLFYSIFFRVQVIGQSMQPTFNVNLPANIDTEAAKNSIYKDIVVVNRYGTGTNGDIILIETPNEVIIKRIIATGGQTLTLRRDGSDTYYHYYLNGVKIDEYYLGDNYEFMGLQYYNLFVNAFDNDDNYNFQTETKDGFEQASIVVPIGTVFALGDNRGNTSDSLTYGCFSLSKIKGKVSFYYAYNETMFDFFWSKFVSVFN